MKSIHAMSAHLKFCGNKTILNVVPERVIDCSQFAKKYLKGQHLYLEFNEHLRTGYVETMDKERVKGYWRHYLEIAKYVTLHGIQGVGGDDLLSLVKNITYSNGNEVAIPTRMRTLMKSVYKMLKGTFFTNYSLCYMYSYMLICKF